MNTAATSTDPAAGDLAGRRVALARAYGSPAPFNGGEALRLLGRRGHVHPRDAFAFLYADRWACAAWQAATAIWHGVPALGTYLLETGQVVGVYDLRPALAEFGAAATDPALADQWEPTCRRGGRRRGAGG